ncbi:hypothetical protein OUZ56_013781 [Daphnia magna]|uniref:Uncharacterized protein n=1 Tax=Daphnia magna TaxID=35525 RepID=A0ABQ9Z6W9_9CRUS|nr:hypothetical protein OUZ56_013781 [Daphnia magna]
MSYIRLHLHYLSWHGKCMTFYKASGGECASRNVNGVILFHDVHLNRETAILASPNSGGDFEMALPGSCCMTAADLMRY